MTAGFFVDLYQNDIFSNLADAFPGDDIFRLSAEETAETTWTWHNYRSEAAGFAVKFHIHRTAQAFAGTDINDLFLF